MAEEPASKKVKVIFDSGDGTQRVEYVDPTGLATVGQVCEKAHEQAGGQASEPKGGWMNFVCIPEEDGKTALLERAKNSLETLEEFEEFFGLSFEPDGENMEVFRLSFKRVRNSTRK